MDDELYTLENLTIREIKALRKGLEFIQISGIDAMFMGMLQSKMSEQIKSLELHISTKAQEQEQASYLLSYNLQWQTGEK